MLNELESAMLYQFFLENDYILLAQHGNEDHVAFDLIFYDILRLLFLRFKKTQKIFIKMIIKITKQKNIPLKSHFELNMKYLIQFLFDEEKIKIIILLCRVFELH